MHHEILIVARTIGGDAVKYVLVYPVDAVTGLQVNGTTCFPTQHDFTSKADCQRIEVLHGEMVASVPGEYVGVELLEIDSRAYGYSPSAFSNGYGPNQVVEIDVGMECEVDAPHFAVKVLVLHASGQR